MEEYASSALLGLVQGLTEFLPVSSSGHLIISGALLGLEDERMKAFEVVIQFGSILAVIFLYWNRFLGLLLPNSEKRFSGVYGLWLLFLTSLPASVVGLLAHDYITKVLWNPVSVSLALAVGAVFILLTEARKRPPVVESVDALTPRLALGIGFFQCLALWPGFSRSTSTIMGGMLLGAGRATAAEYSFLAAVPVMTAATGLSLIKARDVLSMEDLPFFAIGTLVSFLAAIVAIKFLVGMISRMSFRPFAYYRLLLAPAVFYFFS